MGEGCEGEMTSAGVTQARSAPLRNRRPPPRRNVMARTCEFCGERPVAGDRLCARCGSQKGRTVRSAMKTAAEIGLTFQPKRESEPRQRNPRVEVTFSEQQMRELRRAAKAEGLSLAEYVRWRVLA